ncbi:GatB/YqeY domain-containing protein [Priestia filamentosa]|uniref:GatB/YqeY domain-containing protein n=1 Tax=Priestia filamentosa TaxID=1402861 RepID=UPI0039797091
MLNNKLMEDLKQAMKEKNNTKKSVITLLRAGLTNEKIKKQADLTEQEEMAIVRRELKQTKDSLFEFKKAGRDDLVEKEEAKIAILETYLPKQLTEAELFAEIKKMQIGKTKNVGQVIGQVVSQFKEVADGAVIAKVVKEYMNS